MNNSNISKALYFYVEHCLGCKITTPRMGMLESKISVTKINGDKNKKLTKEYDVGYYPTIVILDKNNNILKKEFGANKIEAFISNFLYS